MDWFEPFHKMWSCSFWTLPRRGLSLKNSPPRNTPDSFCRCFTRQNPSLCCMGGIFLLRETHLENFMSRPNVIPTFRQRRCTNRGRNFVRSKRRSTYTSSGTLYLFLHLNNSETFVELVGARPLHLLSQTVLPLKSPTGAFIAPLRFANAVPPQTLLMVRTWRCEQQRRVVLYITSPRSYRTDRRYNDQNECSIDP